MELLNRNAYLLISSMYRLMEDCGRFYISLVGEVYDEIKGKFVDQFWLGLFISFTILFITLGTNHVSLSLLGNLVKSCIDKEIVSNQDSKWQERLIKCERFRKLVEILLRNCKNVDVKMIFSWTGNASLKTAFSEGISACIHKL